MRLLFHDEGWDDYLYWRETDKKILKKINDLIKACKRSPFDGIGKPEPLKGDLTDCWSRRITDEHRFVYYIEDNMIIVLKCRHHYKN
jgi:toxin YoeB